MDITLVKTGGALAALLLSPLTGPAVSESDGVPAATAPSVARPASSPASSPRDEVGSTGPIGEPVAPGDWAEKDLTPGGSLRVNGVRVSEHDGFDRVVLDLSQTSGDPGYLVGYADAVNPGSGEPIDVEGEEFLQVSLLSEELSDFYNPGEESFGNGDAEHVQDVVRTMPRHGQIDTWIGVEEGSTFSVDVLQDPNRAVIDIRHPD